MSEFQADSLVDWFRFVDDQARRSGLPVLRLQAGSDKLALVAPLQAFCTATVPGLRCSVDPQYEPLIENDDRLLFLSSADALYSVDDILSTVARQDARSERAEWIALPAAWRETTSLQTSGSIGQKAGLLVFAGPAGVQSELELRLLGTAILSRQLRRASPRTKILEGPDNLRRRESWFRGKSGGRR
ncbi:MAG TPA: hypothetical protein VGL70_22285 [Candidatus Binatia bacterium]